MRTYDQRIQDVKEKEKAYKKRKKLWITGICSVSSVCIVLVLAILISQLIALDRVIITNHTNSKIKVSDYGEIFDKLSTAYNDMWGDTRFFDSVVNGLAEKDLSVPENAVASQAQGETPNYSDTNVQVEGVQEADIVKTDGKYIYTISQNYLHIVLAENGQMQELSRINCSETDEENKISSHASELYVVGDTLIILRNANSYADYDENKGEALCRCYWIEGYVVVDIFDITDRSNPIKKYSYGQDGSYSASRMNGTSLYLITNMTMYNEIDRNKPETFIPALYKDGKSFLISPENIIVTEQKEGETSNCQYVVVSGIDTMGDKGIVSTQALFGLGTTIYASKTSLYVAGSGFRIENGVETGTTKLMRFSLNEENVQYEKEGTVDGSLLNQFAMDEYNGYLRVVTSCYTYKIDKKDDMNAVSNFQEYNSLFVLDNELNVVGKIEHLAKDETVYSVRFDGDIAYFVTFRQIDPLFSADLSDPNAPVILGELKIPGFSNYLHPYSEGLLFGLGMDATEQGSVESLKLSMFDVSDPKNVIEKHKLVLSDYFYSEASYNHKAIIIDSEKEIIAFPAESKYVLYSYSDISGFTKLAEIGKSDSYDNLRGLYIGEVLYVIGNEDIFSYSMKDYTNISTVKLSGEDNSEFVYYD